MSDSVLLFNVFKNNTFSLFAKLRIKPFFDNF